MSLASLPVSGIIDISSIDKQVNECIQVQVNLTDTATIVSNVQVNWEPLPLFTTTIAAPQTKKSCGTTSFNIAYALSYASDEDIVLYSQLPSSTYAS